MKTYGHVLSIQSHVTHGHVGNSAAAFPLQMMGFQVDPIHTVTFSNHVGYPTVRGRQCLATEITDIFEGLVENGFTDAYTHVLSGYIGDPAGISAVGDIVSRIRASRPPEGRPLTYVCDPVFGDEGDYYLTADHAAAYRPLLPHTDLLTPNSFEAGILAGREELATLQRDIQLAALVDAADALHEQGVPRVVVSSAHVRASDLGAAAPTTAAGESRDVLCAFASERASATGSVTRFVVPLPTVSYTDDAGRPSSRFCGAGDVMAACVLAFEAQHDALIRERAAVGGDGSELGSLWGGRAPPGATSLQYAVAQGGAVLHAILSATADAAQQPLRGRVSTPELELLRSRDVFVTPPPPLTVVRVCGPGDTAPQGTEAQYTVRVDGRRAA